MGDRVSELIQREIDGINSPAEQRALQEALARDEAAAAQYDDLRSAVQLLERVEALEPPAQLKGRVMAALPAHRYAQASPHAARGWFDALRRLLQARPRLAVAYTFAVGMVAGLALMGIWGDVLSDSEQDAYGTLLSQDAIAAMRPADEARIGLDALHGYLRVQSSDRQVVLEISLDARQPADVRVIFDEAALPLRGISRFGDEPGPMLRAEAGSVSFAVLGTQHFAVAFDRSDAGANVNFEILQDGRVRLQEILRTQPR